MPDTKSSVTPQYVLQSWQSPFPFQRGTMRLLFQSVGMMPVFQAEHRTACNDTSAAFPPALKFSMDATDPWSFTPFQPVHRSLCFHKQRWTTVGWRVNNRDCNTPDVQLNRWWISLVQPLKGTGPAGLHFGLLFQEPTTLCSNCSTPRDGLG